jgi:DNA-binding MarR family transcriptional regulator
MPFKVDHRFQRYESLRGSDDEATRRARGNPRWGAIGVKSKGTYMQEGLDLENRRFIFGYIKGNPGAHLREISRDLNINLSTLRYHLDYLEDKGLIKSQKENNLKLYFASGELEPKERMLAPLLRQKRFRDIILIILASPESTSSQIADRLLMHPSTASKYINILEDRGMLSHKKVGREKRYHVNDEKEVVKLLLTYKESFWDSFVDNVLDIYFAR